MRRGVTLVETLVALVLLELGMLALAATTAVVARDYAAARRTDRAHVLARNRLEELSADPCDASGGSLTVGGGYELTWTVAGGRKRELHVSVAFVVTGGRRKLVHLRSAALCGG